MVDNSYTGPQVGNVDEFILLRRDENIRNNIYEFQDCTTQLSSARLNWLDLSEKLNIQIDIDENVDKKYEF